MSLNLLRWMQSFNPRVRVGAMLYMLRYVLTYHVSLLVTSMWTRPSFCVVGVVIIECVINHLFVQNLWLSKVGVSALSNGRDTASC